MGMRVRYDGQDKFKPDVVELIAPHVRLLPLCPESMAGMGIPRAPVNLISAGDSIQAVGRDDPERNVSARLRTMGGIIGRTYPDLCGYILQSRSPSCGFETTPIYNQDQTEIIEHQGNGLFVAELIACLPDLPILNDRQLDQDSIRSFLQSVHSRAEQITQSRPS